MDAIDDNWVVVLHDVGIAEECEDNDAYGEFVESRDELEAELENFNIAVVRVAALEDLLIRTGRLQERSELYEQGRDEHRQRSQYLLTRRRRQKMRSDSVAKRALKPGTFRTAD